MEHSFSQNIPQIEPQTATESPNYEVGLNPYNAAYKSHILEGTGGCAQTRQQRAVSVDRPSFYPSKEDGVPVTLPNSQACPILSCCPLSQASPGSGGVNPAPSHLIQDPYMEIPFGAEFPGLHPTARC